MPRLMGATLEGLVVALEVLLVTVGGRVLMDDPRLVPRVACNRRYRRSRRARGGLRDRQTGGHERGRTGHIDLYIKAAGPRPLPPPRHIAERRWPCLGGCRHTQGVPHCEGDRHVLQKSAHTRTAHI